MNGTVVGVAHVFAVVTAAGALAVAAASPAGAVGGAPAFLVPATASSGGTLPADVATADVDGDGNTDVVVANKGPVAFNGGVAVARGNGTGGLAAPVLTALPDGWGACDVAARPLDGDNLADVVATGCSTGGAGPIFVLRATGGGALTVVQTLANDVTGHIVLADLGLDGDLDLVFSAVGSPDVRVYQGRPGGTFRAAQAYAAGQSSYAIVAGDATGDGRPDLLGGGGGPLWVMPATPSGGLAAQIVSPVQAFALAVGDLDGNGTLDAATTDASGGHVFVAAGAGNGTFSVATTFGGVAAQTESVAIGDFDADGRADIVANGPVGNAADLFAGRGGFSFRGPAAWLVGATGYQAAQLDASPGDDLVAFSIDPGVLYATPGARSGFRTARVDPRGLRGVPADLDGDGNLDVVWAATDLVPGTGIVSEIVARLGDGRGTFGPPVVTRVRSESAGSGANSIAVADLNGDGLLDVAGGITNLFPSPNNLFVALGTGGGHFGRPAQYTSGDVDADIASLALVDVTSDGHPDIVSHTRTQMSVLPGLGGKNFGAPILSGSSSFVQVSTLVGDVTGDGVGDALAVLKTGGEDFGLGEVRVNQGDGAGHFTLVQTLSYDGNSTAGVLADLNGDGHLDVAAVGTRGSNGGRTGLRVMLDDGAGPLAQPVFYARGGSGLTGADFDLDGDVDLTTDGILAVQVDVNPGNGTFPTFVTVPAPSGGVEMSADFTNDGRPDIGIGGAVLLNRSR
jgi:hypothetical protein